MHLPARFTYFWSTAELAQNGSYCTLFIRFVNEARKMPREKPESVKSRMKPMTRNFCEAEAKSNEAKPPRPRPKVKV